MLPQCQRSGELFLNYKIRIAAQHSSRILSTVQLAITVEPCVTASVVSRNGFIHFFLELSSFPSLIPLILRFHNLVAT